MSVIIIYFARLYVLVNLAIIAFLLVMEYRRESSDGYFQPSKLQAGQRDYQFTCALPNLNLYSSSLTVMLHEEMK